MAVETPPTRQSVKVSDRTAQLLRVLAAIDGTSQAEIADSAVAEYVEQRKALGIICQAAGYRLEVLTHVRLVAVGRKAERARASQQGHPGGVPLRECQAPVHRLAAGHANADRSGRAVRAPGGQ
jgi:hypothetical protein